jgi:hypothetical protein
MGSMPVVSENSIGPRRLSMVVLEQRGQTLPGLDNPFAFKRRLIDQHGFNTLVAALVVIVSRALGDGSIERLSPRGHNLIETLGLDRLHESFRIRLHVRCLARREKDFDAGIPDNRLESWRERRVSINDQEALRS